MHQCAPTVHYNLTLNTCTPYLAKHLVTMQQGLLEHIMTLSALTDIFPGGPGLPGTRIYHSGLYWS